MLETVDGHVAVIERVAVLEDALQELLNVFLIAHSVLVPKVLTLFVLVEAFSLTRSLIAGR